MACPDALMTHPDDRTCPGASVANVLDVLADDRDETVGATPTDGDASDRGGAVSQTDIAGQGDAAGIDGAPDQVDVSGQGDSVDQDGTPDQDDDGLPVEVLNALADVFKDVTRQSADSQLVTPARWDDLGLVPSGMDLLDFGAIVLNFLADHPDTDEPEPEPDPIPDGYELVERDGECVLVQVDPDPPVRRRAIHCATIRTLMGHDTFYLFDEARMTAAYANWSFMALEDDKVMTFVNCVREESRVYPRPMLARTLKKAPFNMTAEEIEQTFDIIREGGAYPDIETLTASNGDVYYYSTDYLKPGYARALAQWQSVDRWMNT